MTHTILASQTTFEKLTEHYQEQNLAFEISANEVFHLPDLAPKKKNGPLKFENEASLKRIIFYSNFALQNNKTVSFDVINWEKSTSHSARYDTYEFTTRQERSLLKLTRFQESHPRDLALMQNAAILDYIDDVILVTEAEPIDEIGPRIIYVNQAFEKMSGYTFSEIFGKTPRIFQGEKTADADRKKIREALKRWEPITIEIVNYTKSKLKFDVELTINPRKDEVGWYTHWVSVQRDVTARKETQRLLEHHSKLALIGEIAAGVGHEINNPIAIIKGFLEMTLSSLKAMGVDDEKIYLNFERMDRASDRIINIAKGLRTFARIDSDESGYFCVYEMIQETVDMLCDVYKKEGVILKFSSAKKKLTVFGNRGRFQQAVTNLIANAKDATEGREIRIISIHADLVKSNVLITIKDNGQGIPNTIRDKIFQPFFTTKEVNKGTGIGLSIVSSIIHQHNGILSFESELGEGTIFSICLPSVSRVHEGLDVEKIEEIILVETDDRFQVLVVEDEEDLREIMDFNLTKIGLSVHLAEDGKIALEMIKARHFDLIISDISMPVMDGITLFNLMVELNILQPPKFMFITGEVGRENERLRDIIHNLDEVLEKPFNPEVFLIKMNALFPSKFLKD